MHGTSGSMQDGRTRGKIRRQLGDSALPFFFLMGRRLAMIQGLHSLHRVAETGPITILIHIPPGSRATQSQFWGTTLPRVPKSYADKANFSVILVPSGVISP
jgi:hypothetical protein